MAGEEIGRKFVDLNADSRKVFKRGVKIQVPM